MPAGILVHQKTLAGNKGKKSGRNRKRIDKINMEKITEYLIRPTVTEQGIVRVWEEIIPLPTYPVGKEEKNPIFLEKRVYQGSSGKVYPYPVVEKISDEKSDKPYRAFFLENEYLKIMILPELGGRVQMAYDKIKKRHFVYYNQVIKPALVGLTGPWISGGIEFNWPQHHRPSTFLPTDCLIEEHADGSKTVWCNEVERISRTKGMQGFTLRPGKACLEINVQIYNRTSFPQTFLWWANPAVVVHEHYHSVFPPDVHAVFDHGKRDVSRFPIATGVYYKQDYSAGVDISRYKNIPVPTSYMAIRSKYDFVGGFEENVKGGLLHVANHHVSPGKKQWTWGCGDFGQAWDRNLTDEDGPYIELMAGVYTDNQPDFSWLQPYEEKSWTQYFMPYSELGYVKNANKDALVNMETRNGKTEIMLYTTSAYKNLNIVLKDKDKKTVWEKTADVSPAEPFRVIVDTENALPEELLFELWTGDKTLLLSYRAEKPEIKPVPEPAPAAKAPEAITSIEQLYLTGLHLEQYRHATCNPSDYYLEALKREPGDVRCNNAVGLLYMRRGQFALAEPCFRRAVQTLTERNPNPYDGEPYYNLGWSLRMQEKNEDACDAFFKAAWNVAWQDSAYFALAQLYCLNARWEEALEQIERSLVRNWHNHKARHLKASILRKLGRKQEALQWIEDSLVIDPFNLACYFEKYRLTGDTSVPEKIEHISRHSIHDFIEYALDFAAAGMYPEAETILLQCTESGKRHDNPYPVTFYALGYFASKRGDAAQAKIYYRQAAEMNPDYCFPNRIEEVNILQDAIAQNPSDAKAPYYLGNFWYAARQYSEAIACWEHSANIDDTFPTVLRNLALAYYNQLNDKVKAKEFLEKAFALDNSDARILMELDQLYKKLKHPHSERLAFLEQYLPLTEQRDDLCIERITLYNQLGEYEKAMNLIAQRKFHPWEGGEGKVTGQYVLCRMELAKQAIQANRFDQALELLKETEAYPHHLGEGKLTHAEENDVYYYKGLAYRGLNDETNARLSFEQATKGSSEPQQAFFYNDNQPDKIFYQGLAWRALGNEDKANSCFNKLIDYGEKHLFDACKIDYFAVSLPDLAIWDDDLNVRNQIHCNYVMGLGYLGLNSREKANGFLGKVREMDVNHQGAQIHLITMK
jgi:tetratricopeptide (TPR) repeat protein